MSIICKRGNESRMAADLAGSTQTEVDVRPIWRSSRVALSTLPAPGRRSMAGGAVLASVILFMALLFQIQTASGQQVGDRVALKATHHLGIPFHIEPSGNSSFQRISDGIIADVLERTSDGRWFKIQLADGKSGWVHQKYIDHILLPAPTPTPAQPGIAPEVMVWDSRAGCQQVVAAGGRMAPTQTAAIRIADWNIRWYAKGCSQGEDCPENATDNQWLACAITWMNVDLLTMQEVLSDSTTITKMNQLVQELDLSTGGHWRVDLQQCGAPKSQHVGFLWNTDAITLTGFADVAQLNGASNGANACAGNLRPGRYAFAQTSGGADFHIVAVHLDSGVSDRDYQHRRAASEQIPFLAVNGHSLLDKDQDILVVGDFNTMGRTEPPPISAEQEIAILDQDIQPAFRRMAVTPACTEYFDNKPGLLDQVIVTNGMQEAAVAAQVTGYCAVKNCQPISGAAPAAYERLSDHCPVVFEVKNEDRDP